MVNVPLLRKELEHVTHHPKEWNQTVWLRRWIPNQCGTLGCLAGNTVLHAGLELRLEPEGTYMPMDGYTIKHHATNLLGLTVCQANALFDGSNSLLDLWSIANRITDGEIEVPQSVISQHNKSLISELE